MTEFSFSYILLHLFLYSIKYKKKRTLNSNKIVLKFINQFHDLIITYNISYNKTTQTVVKILNLNIHVQP